MKVKLFYGWYIVLAALLITTYFSAVFSYGWTSFVTPILATFGWSVTQLSLASTLRGFESGVFNPLWGVAVDRWSLKKLMAIGVIFIGLGMLLISQTRNLWMYYIGFLIMGIAASAVTNMIPTAAIARWFKKDIGKANGMFYMGMGLGGVLVPLVTVLIDRFGWRETLAYSAIGFLIIGLPLSLVFRRRPEDYGQNPDGKTTAVAHKAEQAPGQDASITAKQALRMKVFWYLSIVVFFQSAVLGIMSLFAMPYLEDLGINRTTASFIVSLFTIVTVCTRIPVGMLGDIFQKKTVIAITMGITGISLFLFWLVSGATPFWITILFAIFYGAGISGYMPLRMPIIVEHFGRRNIGTIFGLVSVSSTVGAVIVVPIAGLVFDTFHTYKPVFLALAGCSLASIMLILLMPQAEKTKAAVNTAASITAKD